MSARRFYLSSLFLAATSALSLAQTYTVTDLGAPKSNGYSLAQSVNATGEVTGAVGTDDPNLSGVFLYSQGEMTMLGTLGGSSAIGLGINSSGQIAGYSQNAAGTYRAFLATGGKLTDIGDLGGRSAVG